MTIICKSCGMPIVESLAATAGQSATLCAHCRTANGDLPPFETHFERMVEWNMLNLGLERPLAEETTRVYLSYMPAWKDHPALR